LEYGEDFAAPFRMAGVVATVYRVLEGMPDPEPAASAAVEAEDRGAASAPAPEATAETQAPTRPVEPKRPQGID
jgi:hypothetical protein